MESGQYGQSAADMAEPGMTASLCELGRSPAPSLPSLQLPRTEFTPMRSAGRDLRSYLERWTRRRQEGFGNAVQMTAHTDRKS